LQHTGQFFLHDIRSQALLEAKKRLKRARIQNAQILLPDSTHKSRLLGKMDWVLVDAPCSGTGTLRRNPDMKWKFTLDSIERLVQEQRTIFAEALSYVKPGGHIVYATCSVLPQENEKQSLFFQQEHSLVQVGSCLSTHPAPQEMDGFFGVVLKKEAR
jgi:16S rRNA C967 or C1407 C5-methylase (RsmB/RsmF family)